MNAINFDQALEWVTVILPSLKSFSSYIGFDTLVLIAVTVVSIVVFIFMKTKSNQQQVKQGH